MRKLDYFWMSNDDWIIQRENGTFTITNPENYSGLYLPLAGEEGLKSSITPTFGGDSKTDQNHFLLEPVSIENLQKFLVSGRRKRLLVSMWSFSGAGV